MTDAARPLPPPPDDSHSPVLVIEAQPASLPARLQSLWQYRGFYGFLFRELTFRRARGTLLGLWGVLLYPLIPALGLMYMFSAVSPVETGDAVPYPVFFLSGYLPWRLFQASLRYVPRTLQWSQSLMRRTYFPRLLVPLAGFGMTFIEAAILLAILAVVTVTMVGRGEPFPLHLGWATLWLLPCFIAALLFALAFGLVFSVVALFFRDVIFSLRFFSQLVMLATPVLYPVTFVPEQYRWLLYTVNPMAQIVIVSRWALTGQGELQLGFLMLSFATVLVSLALALIFFLRAEQHLGDQM